VKIIGEVDVPAALILAFLAIINAEAFVPVPSSPFMIVPASIVNVAPPSITTFPSSMYTISDVHTVLVVIVPLTLSSVSTTISSNVQDPSSFFAFSL